MSHYPAFANAGTFTPDNLIAGDFPRKTKTVTLASGTAYKRGDVLMPEVDGDDEPTGNYTICTDNGSAIYILAEDRDASDGDLDATVFMTGEFNINSVNVGAGATKAGVSVTLEARNIYLVAAVAA